VNFLVVIPTYNESQNVKILTQGLVKLGFDCLYIDDGSPDGTAEIVSQMDSFNKKVFLINRKFKRGYASACIAGFKWGIENNYDYLIQMDADLSHDVNDLKIMVKHLEYFDLIIGSRYIKSGKIIGWGIERKLLSKYANKFARLMTRSKVNDLTSGFRIYKTSIFNSLEIDNMQSEGYGFLVEILDQILGKQFKIKEIPITFNNRKFGKSKMSKKVIVDGIYITIKIGFSNYIKKIFIK